MPIAEHSGKSCKEQVFALILESEQRLRQCETWHPMEEQAEYGMFLARHKFLAPAPELLLRPVQSESDWQQVLAVRREVEQAFGLEDPRIIEQLVQGMRRKQEDVHGQWYLAQVENQILGEIGLVPFKHEGLQLGRLQDVDIAPRFQGQGYGHQLLQAICQEAQKANLNGLVLMALQEDWPWRWYRRLGFQVVGKTTVCSEPRPPKVMALTKEP